MGKTLDAQDLDAQDTRTNAVEVPAVAGACHMAQKGPRSAGLLRIYAGRSA
jgi:hypothetical protein